VIGPLLRSRGARKFRRDRMAMFGLGVIVVYLLVAVMVVLGVVDLDDTKRRVLPNRYPGFLESTSLEEELDYARWWRLHVEPLFREGTYASPEAFERTVTEEVDLAERRVVRASADEIRALAEDLDVAWTELEGLWFAYDDMADELAAIEGEARDAREATGAVPAALAEELELARAALAELEPRARASLEAFHGELARVLPRPEGWAGTVYKLRTVLGSDQKGGSVSAQATYSVKIAFQIGLITSLISVLLGTVLGAAAAFYSGWVDHLIMWLVSTLSSIPYLVLLTVIAYMFTGTMFDNADQPALALVPVYVAFCSVFWIGTCRVVRGEVLKIKELEYVQAATALGFPRAYILLRHVVPNTAHLMFINFSLMFIGAIKSEVILSFLGLGVKGQPSWGIMIGHGADGVTSFDFWEVGVATAFMFVLVLAFNVVSDALQDAFDPKHVG
jgi:peptide/nickel transport system permease protein